jgi:hypothetical protein
MNYESGSTFHQYESVMTMLLQRGAINMRYECVTSIYRFVYRYVEVVMLRLRKSLLLAMQASMRDNELVRMEFISRLLCSLRSDFSSDEQSFACLAHDASIYHLLFIGIFHRLAER